MKVDYIEAMKLALEALETVTADVKTTPTAYEAQRQAITALREALAEQPAQQEPVALFEWLPEGATHIGHISVRTAAGGSLAMTTHAFKYDSEVLKVYVTDNDNEYPGWRDAKDCFFHLNFPVLPLYTSPPAQQKPVANNKFTRAWLMLDELPGTMMQGPEGLFGPIPGSTSTWVTTSERERDLQISVGNPMLEVYTSPPAQRKPLTLEEIDLLINGRGEPDDDDYVEPTGDGFGLTDADLVRLVRKTEAAHNIKENT